ncbi:MAG: DeoR/GlpR transcriptional regulator [Phycisphaeraceae bacterium]|nr:DeoR/GlpR transcriptional regulator [Phycisphaeraceae bacterium]
MLIVERHNQLLNVLKQRGSAGLDELARMFDVSVSTIRRDVDTLEERKLVRRTHGGVVYEGNGLAELAPSSGGGGGALAQRMTEQVEQKQIIGSCAAALVQPRMTVLLDGGSTVIFAARQITTRPIQVVTSSLAVAQHFADDDQVELTLIGGTLYPRTGVMVGPLARQCAGDLFADLCFISLAGIDEEAGYNINLELARVERVMIEQAAHKVLLMDSSKFGRRSLVRVCGLDAIDAILTDGGIGAEWRSRLGEKLVVAK